MPSKTQKETHSFQAEVKQLLHLMIHSLYSNREVFLRELISNASDANDRLRFAAISDPDLLGSDTELVIDVDFDQEAGSVTISDNGIGMDRDDVVEQLGTIAKSGTAGFLASLSGDEKSDSRLIGQFGVGFYSGFMVADKVEVMTRKAGSQPEEGVHWESDGAGDFSIESITRAERGTSVVLHLKDSEKDFAEDARLRFLIRKFSDHIAFPVRMPVAAGEDDGEGRETVNAATALWTLPRTKISDEEYREFYKHIAHDFEDPLTWSHNRVEGKREYTSLLYVPARAPFDLWHRDGARGLKLYVQRVFIMDDAEQFLPMYLRFVRGIVDCADLPLNVSRELLQGDPGTEAIKGALTRRVLDMLEKMAQEEPEQYETFWKEFGQVLKEAPAEDPTHQEKVAGLLRFASTRSEPGVANRALADYVQGMAEKQEAIYYLIGDNVNAVSGSPLLETFRDKGIEVLLLSDRIDEWLASNLREFDGHPLVDISRGSLDLGDLESDTDRKKRKEAEQESESLVTRLKEALGDRVEDVRLSTRLSESPACLVRGEHEPGAQMRKILASAGQALPETRPVLEINPAHPLVRRLDGEEDADRHQELARVLFDQANLGDGGELDDPAEFVRIINKLLTESWAATGGGDRGD